MSSNYNSSRVWPEMNARHEEIFADRARTYTRYNGYRGTGNDGQWNKTLRSFFLSLSLSFFLIFWMKFRFESFPFISKQKLGDRYLCLRISISVSLFVTFRSKKFPFSFHKFLFLPRENRKIILISSLEMSNFSPSRKSFTNLTII